VISTFGFVAPHKQLSIILKAFARFVKDNPNSKFLVVGTFLEEGYEKEIKELIKELEILDKVTIIGYEKNLIPYIQISDIIIQLRYPTAGETSGMSLEIMRIGKPVIISNVGWFKELPDDVALKINVDEKEEISIVEAFSKLYDNKDYQKKLSLNARKYVESEHNPEKIALEFSEFLSSIKNKNQTKFIKSFSLKLHEMGFDDSENLYLKKLSKTLRDVL